MDACPYCWKYHLPHVVCDAYIDWLETTKAEECQMTKPREFYLYGTSKKENTVIGFCEIDDGNKHLELLPVIEKSAYDALLKEAEAMASFLKAISDLSVDAEQALKRYESFKKGNEK